VVSGWRFGRNCTDCGIVEAASGCRLFCFALIIKATIAPKELFLDGYGSGTPTSNCLEIWKIEQPYV